MDESNFAIFEAYQASNDNTSLYTNSIHIVKTEISSIYPKPGIKSGIRSTGKTKYISPLMIDFNGIAVYAILFLIF